MSGVLCVMIVIVAYSDCCGGAGSECFNITEQVFPDCFYPLLQFRLSLKFWRQWLWLLNSVLLVACSNRFRKMTFLPGRIMKFCDKISSAECWIYGQYLLAGLRWLTTELGRPTRQTWSNQNSSLPPTANHSALNIVRQAARTTISERIEIVKHGNKYLKN